MVISTLICSYVAKNLYQLVCSLVRLKRKAFKPTTGSVVEHLLHGATAQKAQRVKEKCAGFIGLALQECDLTVSLEGSSRVNSQKSTKAPIDALWLAQKMRRQTFRGYEV